MHPELDWLYSTGSSNKKKWISKCKLLFFSFQHVIYIIALKIFFDGFVFFFFFFTGNQSASGWLSESNPGHTASQNDGWMHGTQWNVKKSFFSLRVVVCVCVCVRLCVQCVFIFFFTRNIFGWKAP